MPVEVLLAEDNEGDARLIKEIVSRCSVAVRITVAEDGEKALALLADPHFKPDLIITDMNMPKGIVKLRQISTIFSARSTNANTANQQVSSCPWR
jgi:CheY-like chemotaxis protein